MLYKVLRTYLIMAYIYKVTNKENGKFYIGRTSYKHLFMRKSAHKWYANNSNTNLPFPNALRKYGVEGFDWEILEECSKEEVGEREIHYIAALKPQYNSTLGGDGGRYGIPCPEHVKEATRQSRIVAVRDRTTGKEYTCMGDAAEDTGLMISSISRSVKSGPGRRWDRIMEI